MSTPLVWVGSILQLGGLGLMVFLLHRRRQTWDPEAEAISDRLRRLWPWRRKRLHAVAMGGTVRVAGHLSARGRGSRNLAGLDEHELAEELERRFGDLWDEFEHVRQEARERSVELSDRMAELNQRTERRIDEALQRLKDLAIGDLRLERVAATMIAVGFSFVLLSIALV